MTIRNYQDLLAWQKAMDLVDAVYTVTRNYPPSERFGLITQMCRAAVSVPSNIAEGQGRTSTKEFHWFLSVAHGSLRELETQIMISQRQNLITAATATKLLEQASEVGKLTKGLMNSLHPK